MATQANIADYLNPRLWTGFVRQAPIPADHIGSQFLPDRDVPGDRLMWDIITAENPIAPYVSIDAESPRMDREQIATAWADILYVRHKVVLRESDLRWIRSWGGPPILNANQGIGLMAAAARDNIARAAARLNVGVDTRKEVMTLQMLQGALTATPQGAGNEQSDVKFSLTAPVLTNTASPLWSNTVTSDPLADLNQWFLNLFWTPAYLIMSNQDWLNLARNAHIHQYLGYTRGYGAGSLAPTFTVSDTMKFFSETLGLKCLSYNSRFTTRTNDGSKYSLTINRTLPVGTAIVLPEEKVGYFANAPAVQNDYRTGKFAWVTDPRSSGRMDPYTTEMGCGMYGLPVLEQPYKVMVLTIG